MEKIFKIWILSLISGLLIYLAFTNRYIIYPEIYGKYDRWEGGFSEMERMPSKNDRTIEELSIEEELDKFLRLRGLLVESDRVKSALATILIARDTLRFKELSVEELEGRLEQLKRIKRSLFETDTLDKKIDSSLVEAIYLRKELNKLLIFQRLSELVAKMEKKLQNKKIKLGQHPNSP